MDQTASLTFPFLSGVKCLASQQARLCSSSDSLLEAAGAPCLSSHLLNLHTAKFQKALRPLGDCCLLEFGNLFFSQEFIPTKSGFLFLSLLKRKHLYKLQIHEENFAQFLSIHN